MTAEEIRGLREQERIDSVYIEPPASKKAWYFTFNCLAASATAIVILIGLYYAGKLTGYVRSLIQPYLWMVDDSSGFLTDMIAGCLNIALFAAIAVFFGFALDINFARNGRPREVWGGQIKFILPAALLSCAGYALLRFFSSGGAFTVGGSILSRCLYYFNMLTIVPAANTMLFLVLPSAIIRMVLTLVSDTKERMEIPMIVASAVIMTLGLLGVNPANIALSGYSTAAFALIVSALCSVLYHRTNVIWGTVLMYSGVSGLYLATAALLNSFA